MKRIFRVFPFSVFAALMAVISCQHDDAVRQNEHVETQEPQLSIIMESGEHLRTLNPTIYQRLSETSRHTGALDNAENDIASFTLDLSMVQIIEQNTYTQYTTSVFDHNDYQTYLINYLFLDFDDGSQYQFLVKYPRIITDQGVALDRENAVMERINGDILLQAENRPNCLNGSVPELLNTDTVLECTTTRCTGNGQHELGDDCLCYTLASCSPPSLTCETTIVNTWSCTGGSAQGPSGDGGTAGGNNTDPNDEPTDGEPIETVPMLSDWEQIEDCMNTASFTENIQLTSAMVAWLQTNNSQVAGAMNAMLQEYSCSEQAQEEIFDEITGLIENESVPRNAMDDNYTIEDLSHDCTRSITIEILTNLKTNFTKLIDKGIGAETNVTLDFKNIDIVNTELNAYTQMDDQISIDSGDYHIFIQFSNNYLNGNPTKLSIAATAIHEMVHAQLVYLYLKGTLLNEYPQYTDLKAKFDAFIADRSIITGRALNDAMHIVMVDFIETIAYTLFKYTQDNGMENITHEYCKDITKGTFFGTPAMNTITPDVNLQNGYILKAQNEQNNTADAKGKDC